MAKTPAERQRAYRQRLAEAEGRTIGPVGRPRTAEHGSASRWRAGCRCRRCSKAHAADVAAWRAAAGVEPEQLAPPKSPKKSPRTP